MQVIIPESAFHLKFYEPPWLVNHKTANQLTRQCKIIIKKTWINFEQIKKKLIYEILAGCSSWRQHARLKILWHLAMRIWSQLLVQISFFLVASMGFCTTSFLDWVACIGSSTAVMSVLPQIMQLYRTKSVNDVSMLMLLNLFLQLVWLFME